MLHPAFASPGDLELGGISFFLSVLEHSNYSGMSQVAVAELPAPPTMVLHIDRARPHPYSTSNPRSHLHSLKSYIHEPHSWYQSLEESQNPTSSINF